MARRALIALLFIGTGLIAVDIFLMFADLYGNSPIAYWDSPIRFVLLPASLSCGIVGLVGIVVIASRLRRREKP